MITDRSCQMIFVFSLITVVFYEAQASCGVSFCSIDTKHVETLKNSEGSSQSSFDFRFEYIDQHQPKAESRSISVGEIPAHHDEVSTLNQNAVLGYYRKFNSEWSGSIAVPVVSRNHFHIHNHQGAKLNGKWNFTELGDIQLRGRRSFSNFDTIFGLKLPTGKTTVDNSDNAEAERSLQPGTGTFDWIVGLRIDREWDGLDLPWFAQVHYQRPFAPYHEFEAGDVLGIDIGLKKDLQNQWSLLAQLNSLEKGRDRGNEAETDSSGGRFIFMSPGIAYRFTSSVEVYAFYQRALYQYVNDVQLTSDDSVLINIHWPL